jgi:hypothetical protein
VAGFVCYIKEFKKMRIASMSFLMAGTVLAGTMLAAGQASAQVFIRDVTFLGTGCDESNSELVPLLGRMPTEFTILFNEYIAERGPTIALAQSRKNCNIVVTLNIPQGFQVSIADVLYLGYAEIASGASGKQETTYEFPFFSNAVTLQSTLRGPVARSYRIEDSLLLASLVWSPCGQDANLNMRTQVSLSGTRSRDSFMTTDQITGVVRQVYHLRWRSCVRRASAATEGGGRS